MRRNITLDSNVDTSFLSGYRPTLESYKKLAVTKYNSANNILEGYRLNDSNYITNMKNTILGPLAKDVAEATGEQKVYLEGLYAQADQILDATNEQIIAESAYANEVTPFLALQLPYMYLNAISNVANKIFDVKATNISGVNRNLIKRYVEVAGTKYYFPEALHDRVSLDAIAGKSGQKLEIAVAVTAATGAPAAGAAGSFDKLLSDKLIASGIKAEDVSLLSLVETVNITKIGSDFIAPVKITRAKDGMFNEVVTHGTGNTAVTLIGKIDFKTMTLVNCSVDTNATLTFEVYVDAGSGASAVSVGSDKKEDSFRIGTSLSLSTVVSEEYFFDKKAIENIDGTAEILANFHLVSNAVEDDQGFQHLIANENPINPYYSDGGSTATPISLTSANAAVVPIEYSKSQVLTAMMDMATDLSTTLNAPGKSIFFAHPKTCNLVEGIQDLQTNSVGGVATGFSVMNIKLGQYQSTLVASERIPASDATNPLLTEIKATMSPNVKESPVNEMFKMPSLTSYNRRSPENPYLPAITVDDRYKFVSIFPLASKRVFTHA